MFDFSFPTPGDWINPRLLGSPMNWAMIWVVASIWLLLFHTAMTAFGLLQATGRPAFGAGPGQLQAPTANAPGVFSTPGVLAGGATQVPGLFTGGGSSSWTDNAEAKYAEDGWIANP